MRYVKNTLMSFVEVIKRKMFAGEYIHAYKIRENIYMKIINSYHLEL